MFLFYLNLTNKSNLIGRVQYDLMRFDDITVKVYFLDRPVHQELQLMHSIHQCFSTFLLEWDSFDRFDC